MKTNLHSLIHASSGWIIALAVVLQLGAGCAQEPKRPEEALPKGYLAELKVERNESWFQRRLREYRTYEYLWRARVLKGEGRLKEAGEQFREYLAIDPIDLEVRYEYLTLLYKTNQYQGVIEQADTILGERPRFVPALIYRGLAHQRVGQLNEAIEDFRSAIAVPGIEEEERVFALNMTADLALANERYSLGLEALQSLLELEENYKNYLRKGIALEGLARLEEAERAYLIALDFAHTPEHRLKVYRALGEAAKKRDDWQGAKKAFLSALELDPEDLESMRSLGEIAYARKDYREAALWFGKALKGSSKPEDRELLANILYSLGDYEAAAREYVKLLDVIEEKEERHRVYMALGNVYTLLGEYTKASDAFMKAALIKDDFPTLSALAESLRQGGRIEEAIGYLKGTLKARPAARTRFRLALLYAEVGEDDEAVYHLEEALRGDLPPRLRAEAHFKLGTLYVKLGRSKEALAHYEEALKGDLPTSLKALAYKQQGFLLHDMNREQEALRAFERALALTGDHKASRAIILENLGYIYMQLKQYKTASDYFQRAIEAGRDGWKIRENLGFALYSQRRWDEALEQFRTSLEYKETPRSMVYVARCFKQLEKPGMAIYYLQRALTLGENGGEPPTPENEALP